jgi:hypothetical protein
MPIVKASGAQVRAPELELATKKRQVKEEEEEEEEGRKRERGFICDRSGDGSREPKTERIWRECLRF